MLFQKDDIVGINIIIFTVFEKLKELNNARVLYLQILWQVLICNFSFIDLVLCLHKYSYA